MRLLYDRAGAAEMLSTSERRIEDLRRAGMLTAVTDGKDYKYRLEDLRSYTEALKPWSPEAALPGYEGESGSSPEPSGDPRPSWASTWLTRQEVTERLRLPRNTLAAWASQGIGPKYHRFGRHARYKLSDVEEWEQTALPQRPTGSQ